jgi:alkylhydroperoxidase family enzyme
MRASTVRPNSGCISSTRGVKRPSIPIVNAALAWTEAVTLVSETHVPDDVYEAVRAQFSEAETVNLTMLVATINAWNRIAISFRTIPPVKAKIAA